MVRLTAEAVGDMVRDHVQRAAPLSVIRLGDGESRLLGWPEFSPHALVMQQMVYWFGRDDFDDQAIMKMAVDLRSAVAAADVIGVPRKDQIARNADYANVMRYVRHYKLTGHRTQFTNASLHRELQAAGWYGELLSELDEVAVITCRDVAPDLADSYDVRVTWVPIPEEGNTGRSPTDHWPRVFNIRQRQLAKRIGAGDLVLIGAGVLGKAYAATVRAAGGVAVDVGSVFDGWAGVLSRSYIASDIETYRL